MARSYAQIVTAIWRDEEFRALTVAEQHLYLLLNTQPDITACGVLPLAVTRWAGRAADTKPVDIVRALDGLAQRNFIVYDRESEELLVRSFIRWDRGYGNPKRQPAIRDAIDLVESPALIAVLAVEVERVGLPMVFRGRTSTGSPAGSAGSNDADQEDQMIQRDADVPTLDQIGDPGEFSQVDSLSNGYRHGNDRASHTDAPEERRVPQPTTHNPQPTTPGSKPLITAVRRSGAEMTLPGTDLAITGMDALHVASVKRGSADRLFGEFWEAYPRKVGKIKARKVWDAAVRNRVDPAAITAGAAAFAANREAWRTPVDKIPHPQTWLNAGRWDDVLEPPPVATGIAVPDSRPAAAVLADGRTLHRKTSTHLDHLTAYGETDA